MKNILLLFPLIIILVGCFNTIEEGNSEDADFMFQPMLRGLVPYDPIKGIVFDDNSYFDYDSLFCYYGIKVVITDSDWNIKHDSLRVQRLKIDNDTNWWDYASLQGKRRGDTEWEEVCNKGMLPDTLDSCYYRMLNILDVIGRKIESRLYYFDSVDWTKNQEYYESLFKRGKVEFSIDGKICIARPNDTLDSEK